MTKRKSDEDRAKCKPRKRVAFTAPSNVATKAIILSNASNSPLLRLPLEIRNKVWGHVLGNQLIHLKYHHLDHEMSYETNEEMQLRCNIQHESGRSGCAWEHHICQDDGPESREDEKTIASNGDICFERPHKFCERRYDLPDPITGISYYNIEGMTLRILRSCRQAYVEANMIFWATNTFAFADSTTFKRFMTSRSIHQKRLIRQLRLDIDWHFDDWKSALTMTTLRSVTGLRHLRLRIDYQMRVLCHQTLKGSDMLYSTTYCEPLQKLSTLPLTEVEVAVKNPFYLEENETIWSQNDREEYADGLRNLLLNQRGAEIYAEDQRQLKEESRKDREYWEQAEVTED